MRRRCKYEKKINRRNVSVPSRGILFPNSNYGTAKVVAYVFPSPLGVSYFQIRYISAIESMADAFPSPLGVSYFQIKIVKLLHYAGKAKFPSPLGVSYFQIKIQFFMTGWL